MRVLMRDAPSDGRGGAKQTAQNLQRLRAAHGKKAVKKKPLTLEDKFFQAGMFSEASRRRFRLQQILFPIVLAGAFAALLWYVAGPVMAIVGLVLGLFTGKQMPMSILDRKIAARGDEIMFYLPLVLEQIVIGVSSSLDVGPCIQRVVEMANERDSHNAVTELLRHAQMLMKSGIPMTDALVDIGTATGHTELKHAFMALGQVAKHGGEITRQLQELADAVANQREAKVEAKIKRLELEATGPVGLVFLGFLIVLMSGIGVQLMKAFKY